jgi:hypothetical protein
VEKSFIVVGAMAVGDEVDPAILVHGNVAVVVAEGHMASVAL